jgi:hypothetical protein
MGFPIFPRVAACASIWSISRGLSVSVRSRNLSKGKRWAFDKMIRRTRIFSPYIYQTKKEAADAEHQESLAFLQGKKTPLVSKNILTVEQLVNKRVLWLREPRSQKHAASTENALKRALWYAKDWKDLPVTAIDAETGGEMKSGWAADLSPHFSRTTLVPPQNK